MSPDTKFDNELTPADAHRILTNLAAQHALEQASAAQSTLAVQQEDVVAHYVGDGYYILPGLPARDLVVADLEGSGWTLEQIVKIEPPVYVALDNQANKPKE